MNAELIANLREMGGRLRDEAADALEAADKRIAELEAREKILVSANSLANIERNEAERNYLDSVEVNTALQHGLYEAERKLAVARKAMTKAAALECNGVIRAALAQIGGDGAGS